LEENANLCKRASVSKSGQTDDIRRTSILLSKIERGMNSFSSSDRFREPLCVLFRLVQVELHLVRTEK
jgi:hypothetical protein